MILQRDVPLRRPAVARPLPELARGDSLLPIAALEFVLDHFLAIQPVLDVVTADDDADLVPFVCWFHHSCGGGVQAERGSGGGKPIPTIRVTRIVEDLHFGPGLIGGLRPFSHPVHDPAVPALRDLPLEHQLEVPVLLCGDEVGALRYASQGPVLHRPTSRGLLLLIAAPAGRSLAIKEEPPAGIFFGLGQGVEWRGRLLGEHRRTGECQSAK